MLIHPILLLDAWQIILYIAIILVALVSLVALGCLMLLMLQLRSLVRHVRGEITSLLDHTQQTLRAVQGTTEFVSAGLVRPAIHMVSSAAGVARTISVLRRSIVRARPSRLRRAE